MKPGLIERLENHYRTHPNTWYLGIAILAFLVYHFRLGFLPLRADEPTRTVVALEMMLSGNYWTPTINGEWYYRKPPFYNWILIGLMQLTGSKSEFLLRLPSSVPLFLFAFTIFQHSKKYISHFAAFLAALMFVLCGRMLIYASFLGHIDIFYSWITYLGFIVLFEKGKQGKWLEALMYSYILHAIGFLCKGLPSVLFTGLSAIAIICLFSNWKKIFSWQHILSFLIFAGIISAYFSVYNQYNDLDGWVAQLWDQSAQRTVIDEDKQWWEGLVSIIKFPVDHLMHLAPFLLFIPVFFLKGFRTRIKESSFLKAFGLIFLVNIPVYWLSPGYYPRYLFMLYPIVFIFLGYYYTVHKNHKVIRGLEMFLGGILILLTLAPFAVLFVDFKVEQGFIKALLCFLIIGVGTFLYWRHGARRWLYLFVCLIGVRLAFNFFVMEHRYRFDRTVEYKEDAIAVAKLTAGSPLYLFPATPINHESTFYVEVERNEILRYHEGELNPGDYLIARYDVSHEYDENIALEEVAEMQIRYEKLRLKVFKAVKREQ
ncbi:ArnT family glycosyltransferase [Luteibaculum oceani]|uniref:Glycosyltransferase RgtA/B/C/D-like domain-containing protein n=1 Tax=Luteibaculum oceani TaxID=1294296 RepID=A0A5C6UWF7_9FLAO|nr:hypothetical protein [Luteibaculum oceani]TXC76910.1 hypothetical protein FRX97_09850 [Luteibaculum oceani]